MSDYARRLVGEMFRGINNLNLQGDLMPYMLAIADLADLPLFLSHSTPPVYAGIVRQLKDACQ